MKFYNSIVGNKYNKYIGNIYSKKNETKHAYDTKINKTLLYNTSNTYIKYTSLYRTCLSLTSSKSVSLTCRILLRLNLDILTFPCLPAKAKLQDYILNIT